jgi:chromosome segregation ATPase
VAGSLLLEVERLKERLQRQADIAVRAEAALTQMAVASKQTQEALRKQLAEARVVAVAATEGRDKIEHEHERLHQERADMVAKIATLEVELDDARHAVTEDRATLAATVRNATAKEEGLEETCASLRCEHEQLTAQVAALQRRLDEETELLEAARNQLYDYRQMVGTVGAAHTMRVLICGVTLRAAIGVAAM